MLETRGVLCIIIASATGETGLISHHSSGRVRQSISILISGCRRAAASRRDKHQTLSQTFLQIIILDANLCNHLRNSNFLKCKFTTFFVHPAVRTIEQSTDIWEVAFVDYPVSFLHATLASSFHPHSTTHTLYNVYIQQTHTWYWSPPSLLPTTLRKSISNCGRHCQTTLQWSGGKLVLY